MENSLKEKYRNFSDEKLNSILIAKKGAYEENAIKTAEEVLKERGHSVDLKQLFYERFYDDYDEDLIIILQTKKEEYPELAIEVIEEILTQRGGSNFADGDRMNANSEKDVRIEQNMNDDEEEQNEMSSLTKIVLVVVFSLVFILRMASFNGSGWGIIGLILPVAIIFLLLTQRK